MRDRCVSMCVKDVKVLYMHMTVAIQLFVLCLSCTPSLQHIPITFIMPTLNTSFRRGMMFFNSSFSVQFLNSF